MPFDTYLKFEGGPKVEGETTAKGHEGQIEVYSFSWGASNPTTVSPGKEGLSASRVSISSFNVMKKTEKSSPVLFSACCTGQAFDKCTVAMRKATGESGGQKPFLEYIFENVMVESVQWSGSSGGDDTPTESVSLAFAKCTVKYGLQQKDGSIKPGGETSWDLTKVTK
jgi:type VI secretion system secreted protein Hcp